MEQMVAGDTPSIEMEFLDNKGRAVTRTLAGNSFQIDQFEFDLKRNTSAEHEYMNVHPPPPPPHPN